LPIDFNGRSWNAQFSAAKRDLYTGFDLYFPWLAMLAGFVGTMLIYALFHTLSSSRLRAIRMAKAMTKELRDSQAKLQVSHQKLRRLAAHADQIKEGERKRIAREIHDDLGQNLLALRIEADMLAARTRERHPRLHERARSTLFQIDATIKSVRQIINDLRPNVLDLGLNAAVDWQITEFERRTGTLCELVENQKDIRLDDHCATAFFRILQESLSNISRHASASIVKVELQMRADRLTMTVSDNGIGLLAGGRNKVGSYGLVGIEERINILGGTFSIMSSPGTGTTVCVSVPVHASDAMPDADATSDSARV
jgi:signal transduction histidine kinase